MRKRPFYDSDKYECPYCNTELLKDHSIVHEGRGAAPPWTRRPAAGPVAGWLVVLDGVAKGRDLRLGIGRSFLGLDTDGTPVTLSADAPLSAARPPWSTTPENAFTLLLPVPPELLPGRGCLLEPSR